MGCIVAMSPGSAAEADGFVFSPGLGFVCQWTRRRCNLESFHRLLSVHSYLDLFLGGCLAAGL